MQGLMLGRGKTWWEACCNSVVCSVRETTHIRDFITAFVGVFTWLHKPHLDFFLSYFYFNTPGAITVKKPKSLDYEVKNKIHLSVLAENSLDSAFCEVMVLIQDVNDNVPKFEQSYYKASVWEGQSPKTDIVQVSGNISSQAQCCS